MNFEAWKLVSYRRCPGMSSQNGDVINILTENEIFKVTFHAIKVIFLP